LHKTTLYIIISIAWGLRFPHIKIHESIQLLYAVISRADGEGGARGAEALPSRFTAPLSKFQLLAERGTGN